MIDLLESVKSNLHEAKMSRAEWEASLAKDRKDLEKAQRDLETIKKGGTVQNLSPENAVSSTNNLKDCIRNKEKMLSEMPAPDPNAYHPFRVSESAEATTSPQPAATPAAAPKPLNWRQEYALNAYLACTGAPASTNPAQDYEKVGRSDGIIKALCIDKAFTAFVYRYLADPAARAEIIKNVFLTVNRG